MQNYKILIQYDGTNYHGWQIQPNGQTIQGELIRALNLLDGRHVSVHGAGRTDAGVHAIGQVATFFLERQFKPERLRDAINGNLEPDVRVIDVERVADDFHARFSAKIKTYRYRIFTGASISPFDYRYALHYRSTLNVEVMREAATALIGTHDFSAFTVSDSDVENHVRSLQQLEILSDGEKVTIFVVGNGFLRHMVRNIVGTLLEIGRGHRQSIDMRHILESQDRKRAGTMAKAHGLTLFKIDY